MMKGYIDTTPLEEATFSDLIKEGFRGFHVGGIITTTGLHGALAPLIRWAEGRRQGVPAERSHAMLYAGAGNVISQDLRVREAPLSEWVGSDLTSWHNPAWPPELGVRLIAETRLHLGRYYDVLGIVGQLLTTLTLGHVEWFRDKIQMSGLTYCSEFVCAEIRRHADKGFIEGMDCQASPDEMEVWLGNNGWVGRKVRLVG